MFCARSWFGCLRLWSMDLRVAWRGLAGFGRQAAVAVTVGSGCRSERGSSCPGPAVGMRVLGCTVCTLALRYSVGVSAVVLRVAALACGAIFLTAGVVLAAG
jgi:hypothetical protein